MEISILYCVVMLVLVTWFPVTLEFLEGQGLHSFSVLQLLVSFLQHTQCSVPTAVRLMGSGSQLLEHSVQQVTFRAPQMQAFDSFAHSIIPALKTGIDIDT